MVNRLVNKLFSLYSKGYYLSFRKLKTQAKTHNETKQKYNEPNNMIEYIVSHSKSTIVSTISVHITKLIFSSSVMFLSTVKGFYFFLSVCSVYSTTYSVSISSFFLGLLLKLSSYLSHISFSFSSSFFFEQINSTLNTNSVYPYSS